MAFAQDLADARAVGVVEGGGVGFPPPHLLVAALQRAVALAKVDRRAAAVAKDLNLDVTRLLQVFFQVHRIVAEGRLGLGAGGGERIRQIVGGQRHLHAAPAAAGRRLDQHRKADFLGDGESLLVVR